MIERDGGGDERAHALAAELERVSGDALIIVNEQDAIVRIGPHAARLLCVDAAQAIGRRASEVLPLPPVDPDGLPVIDRLRGGERYDAASPAIHGRPAIRWSAQALLGDAGNFVGALYRVRAIEAAPADAFSDAARSFAQRALDVAPFSVLVADAQLPDLPIVYASGALERLTGFTREEVLGRNARIFHGRFGDQPALAVVRRALAAGQSCDVVLWNQRKDGTPFQNRLSLTPVRDARGALTQFIGLQEDVSAREELLARLFRSQSRDLAQSLLGGAVHDLRNLLTIVSAELGMVRDDTSHLPDVTDSLDVANAALQEAGTLVRLLLSPVTRLKSMRGTAAVADIFKTVTPLSRHVAPPSIRVELVLDASAATAHVVGDRGALEQVVSNLMLNAIDAMPAGGKIRVHACAGVPSEIASPEDGADLGKLVTIQIADDGPGMTEDVLARIFDPYFTTKEPGDGMGLGLSTSAALVQAAGGRLRARSRVGEGSTFYITLPAVDDAAPPPSERRRLAALALTGAEAAVVEPDPGVREALCTLLRRRGATVRDAADVASARAFAPALGPTAILIIDGSPLLEGGAAFVEEWLQGPARRALVLGGAHESSSEANASRTDRLPKPFDHDLLLEVLERLAQPSLRP